MNLPPLLPWRLPDEWYGHRRLLFIAEGFEERTTTWLHELPAREQFETVVVLRYRPEKRSRLTDLINILRPRARKNPIFLDYHRFDPAQFDLNLGAKIDILLYGIDEVVIDISVMSKMLIMVLLFSLRRTNRDIRIIYTEPKDYAPSYNDFLANREQLEKALCLPTFGVHQVVRTPSLSSSVMQTSPSLVVAFASFNEQLVRALLSSINPSRLLLVNGRPPRLAWREDAMAFIHSRVVREYAADNQYDHEGRLLRAVSTLEYRETIELLRGIYLEHCYDNRIIVAPTGSKMQAVATGLFKIRAPDVHIEYPTPESFFIEGYSSSEIESIHQIYFENFGAVVRRIGLGV